MDFEEIKNRLREQEPDFLPVAKKRVNGHDTYVCPFPLCTHGTHGDGITNDPKKPYHWTCFSCGNGGDIIDLWKAHKGVDNTAEAVRQLTDYYGLDNLSGGTSRPTKTKPAENVKQSFKEYYSTGTEEALGIPEATEYLRGRGITDAVAKQFSIRYDKSKRAVVIPVSDNYYVSRSIDGKSFLNPKGANVELFNIAALTKDNELPVYITESVFDALSVMVAGGSAIGLNGVANVKLLLSHLKESHTDKTIIVSLDNDSAGEKAAEKLMQGLQELGVDCLKSNVSGSHKDHNESLVAEPEEYKQRVENAFSERFEAEREAYIKTATNNYLQDFMNEISSDVNTVCIPTLFKELDNALDGGLYKGLYIIGAISSLGKTTFTMQIADQIAQSGKDVLIFSLEMARSELISKSVSRTTFQMVIEANGNVRNAKTSRGITAYQRYEHYSQEERDLIYNSIGKYSEYANHIYISEGVGDIGASQISETVKKHIKYTGNIPVVIVDYLQILAPYSDRLTDKQNTDRSIIELKRISRDYNAPVIGISSFNRDNYEKRASMIAFKESGAIEYSSDVLLGMQFKGAGEKGFSNDEAKEKTPREVEVRILKNRNGKVGTTINFKYYPLFNYFEEQ